MKKQTMAKIITDILLTVLLMLLMAFERIGSAPHEWLGVGMFAAFILHHILNRKWTGHLFKGKYTPLRIFQTILVFLVLLTMVSSMISGVILSRHVFDFLPISGGRSVARTVHMLAAYWGFVFMSLHLGFHWNMMMGMAGRLTRGPSRVRSWVLRLLGLGIAVYGVYGFVVRRIGSYMFLRETFVFFDFQEPLFLFYVDYIAIMGLFVWLGHYAAAGMRALAKRKK